jgi:hypothetical protein
LRDIVGPSIPLLLPAEVEAALGLCVRPGRYTEPRTALPVERWPVICALHTEGATLREIAAREGVSHEAVRQVV